MRSLSPFPAQRSSGALPWAARALLVVFAVLLVVLWGWLRNAESRALASMDPDLRRELYERSLAEAEALCARRELTDECRTRLEFLERFPECTASCRDLVNRQLHRPSR